jgi:ubiquinone/menaquinone biosynthesis C-methylase UbiE
MFRWFRTSKLDPLSVSMAGVKLGDRLLVVGCSDPKLIAAVAVKTGLTGRACAVDDDAARVDMAGRAALADGALVETATAPLDQLPYDAASFDLVILRDVLNSRDAGQRPAILGEVTRVLRPGGRALIMNSTAVSIGLTSMFASKPASEASTVGDPLVRLMKAHGFVAVRTLAERDALVFVEGNKA